MKVGTCMRTLRKFHKKAHAGRNSFLEVRFLLGVELSTLTDMLLKEKEKLVGFRLTTTMPGKVAGDAGEKVILLYCNRGWDKLYLYR